jgi:hypothetical protein
MPSSYTTTLGIELMVTGEKSGQWGDITNTNLNIVEQSQGYLSKSIAGGAQTTTLTITDGSTSTSDARNYIIELTGTITGNQIVTVPDGIEKSYLVFNNTTGAFTVQFKTASGTGPTFTATDKGYKIVYTDGTDVIEVPTTPADGSITSAKLATDAVITSKISALQVTNAKLTNSSITINGVAATLGSSVTIAAGTDWQAVKTTTFTAVAGEGYFVNTNAGAFTVTLPATPTLGDEVSFIDYAGTFDTNNLTVGRNSENIQGSAADLTVATERAGFSLVYTDGTQGWLLANN